jgi:LPXTG-site transpeptidase (sortase) family protein
LPEENKQPNRNSAKIVALVGAVLTLAFLVYVVSENVIPSGAVASSEIAAVLAGQEQTLPGLPVRLRIPSINVDAPVEQTGVASDGAMDAPKGPDSVAWFNLGPRPGERGSAVIAGHYGWKDNIPAAFDTISDLQKGDELFVEDDTGTTTVFVVRESRLYDPNADASNVFSSSDGKAHLNLVTCDGAWNKDQKSYSKRLVVFTDKE